MKRIVKKAFLLAIIGLIGISAPRSFGQLNDMGKLLTGGINDAEKLADAYLSPFTNAFAATLNSGWFNTARPHRFPGFDLTLSLNVALIPDQAKSFNVNDLELSSNVLIAGSQTSPTIAGSKQDESAILQYYTGNNGSQEILAEYTLPEGTGLAFVPVPTLQLGIGLPFETDIIVRFIPETGVGDVGNIGLWGAGIKHSLKQYLPGIKRLPVINLSVLAGYTKFYTRTGLEFKPADINAVDNTSAAVRFDNQELDFSVSSFTASFIASADIPFISAYAGVGINSSATNLKMTGWYPVPEKNSQTDQIEVNDGTALEDPIDFKLNGSIGAIQPRVTGGVKFKLAILHIHFDYTYSSYSVITGGVGISIR